MVGVLFTLVGIVYFVCGWVSLLGLYVAGFRFCLLVVGICLGWLFGWLLLIYPCCFSWVLFCLCCCSGLNCCVTGCLCVCFAMRIVCFCLFVITLLSGGFMVTC